MKEATTIFCLAAFCAGCAPAAEGNVVTLRGPGGEAVPVQVEIADDPAERARGLMGRTELREGDGMVFLFERPQPLHFWMKDTLIPLDIAYFDDAGTFVSAATMTPCAADPCATYPSAGPARAALEVPAGFLARHGVGAGWTIDVSGAAAE